MGSPKNEAPLVSQLKSRQSAKIGEIAHDGSSFAFLAQCREAKARQTAKIREIGDALRLADYVALDEQAVVLGLSRSTAWSILQAPHKASGLTAAVINRILAGPELPPAVRKIILEYVNEKVVGLYGHSATRRRKFAANLSERECCHRSG